MKITRRTLFKTGLAATAAGLAGAAYGTLWEPERLTIERVTIAVRKLPAGLEGLRIAVLSDFHLHPFTKLPLIAEAVRLTNQLNADVVVLLGDYVDQTVDAIDELAPALGRLSPRLGVFAVLGNHDHWKGPEKVAETLQRVGLTMLRNRGLNVSAGRAEIHLAGVDSAWVRRADLSAALRDKPAGVPCLLLAHEPDFADTTAADGRVALQLSGHSHGGQIRLPLIGALELPSWGSRYDCGLYHLGPTTLYTNRGIGVVDLPIRLNCPPEITEITLTGA